MRQSDVQKTSPSDTASLRRVLPGVATLLALAVSALVIHDMQLKSESAFAFLAGLLGLVLLVSRFVPGEPTHGLLVGSAVGLAASAAGVVFIHLATRGMSDSLMGSNVWTYAAISCGAAGVAVCVPGLFSRNGERTGRQFRLTGAGIGLLTGAGAMLGVASRLLGSQPAS